MLCRLALTIFAAVLTVCAEPAAKADPSPGHGTVKIEPVTQPPAGTRRATYSQCNVPGRFIALTFDDGPHGAYTPLLLKMLKDRGIKATFFVVGQCVAEYPEITKQITTDGHEIANHSWSHPLLTKMSESSVRDQIDRTHNVIRQTTGVTPVLFRPPYGGFTANQRAWAHANWGYSSILWDVDSNDWKTKSAAKTESAILAQTQPGSIILCHDIHKTTVDAMPATIAALLAKGFKFVTVSELIAMHQEKPAAPKAQPAKSLSAKEAANAATTLEEIKPTDAARAKP